MAFKGLGTGTWGRGLGALGTIQVLDPTTVSTIANTITKVEGYFTPGTPGYPNGSLAYQNNNPGNLVYAGQAGASPGAGGFAYFPTLAAGQQALQNQIQLYAAQGMSIQDMMNIYAPASNGNDPTGYAQTIANSLGVTPDTSLLSLGLPTEITNPLDSLNLPTLDLSSILGGDFSSVDMDTIGMVGLGILSLYAISKII